MWTLLPKALDFSNMCLYDFAEAAYSNQQYGFAAIAFNAAGDYEDAVTKKYYSYYTEGVTKRDEKSWDAARTAFKMANDYSDAQMQINETTYQEAANLYANKQYTEAYKKYKEIKGYKDVDKLLKTDQHLVAAKIEPYKTKGNVVLFGKYEQDNDTRNGSEDIEWIVLDVQNSKCLLISKYCLDVIQFYDNIDLHIQWDKSILRKYLNEDFYNAAFSQSEKKAIITTQVNNGDSQKNSKYNTKGGSNTTDKIFALSYAEANKYFGVTDNYNTNTRAIAAPTAYALYVNANIKVNKEWNRAKTSNGGKAAYWWLRSPGSYENAACYVDYNGNQGFDYHEQYEFIRPAFWLSLDPNVLP